MQVADESASRTAAPKNDRYGATRIAGMGPNQSSALLRSGHSSHAQSGNLVRVERVSLSAYRTPPITFSASRSSCSFTEKRFENPSTVPVTAVTAGCSDCPSRTYCASSPGHA